MEVVDTNRSVNTEKFKNINKYIYIILKSQMMIFEFHKQYKYNIIQYNILATNGFLLHFYI